MNNREDPEIYTGMKTGLNREKRTAAVMIVALACGMFMALIDVTLTSKFVLRSLAEIILFLACPLIYARFDRGAELKRFLRPDVKKLAWPAALCTVLFGAVMAVYFLNRDIFDFSTLANAFLEHIGVPANMFTAGGLYIAVVSSVTEEFFFRGFVFFLLKENASRKFAYIFSATVYAAYHSAMIPGWFDTWLFLLMMAGLIAESVTLNFIDDVSGSVYPSWIVHIVFNLSVYVTGLSTIGSM